VNDLDYSKRTVVSGSNLIIRCGNEVDAYVTPPLHNLGGMLKTSAYHEQRVGYRIDNASVRRETWGVSDDFEALFIPRGTLRNIVNGESIVIEYHPEYTTPETMTINLSGVRDALKASECLARIESQVRPASITREVVVAAASDPFPECGKRDSSVSSRECETQLGPDAPVVAACAAYDHNSHEYRACAVPLMAKPRINTVSEPVPHNPWRPGDQ
jgi:hypothetical protein